MTSKYLAFFVLMSFLILPILQCKGQLSGLNIIVEDRKLSNPSSTSVNIITQITGFLHHDNDTHWRYYLTINITNNSQNSVTLSRIDAEALNVTYMDGSSENLDITGNLTVNLVLSPHSSGLYDWKLSDSGFTKEPKVVWVKLDVFLLGLENPITSTFEIPELSAFFVLLSVVPLTLLIIIKRFSVNEKTHD